MKKRVFFDTDPAFNCTRIETPVGDRFATLPKTAVGVRIVDESEIPSDRTFRNAWKADLSVDMAKAKEIHRKRLREARATKLAELDVAYMRADELNDESKKKAIAAQKQALRDVTADPRIDSALTPQELQAVWLE